MFAIDDLGGEGSGLVVLELTPHQVDEAYLIAKSEAGAVHGVEAAAFLDEFDHVVILTTLDGV
ncbi:MAG: hypothetical protein L7V86_23150, partial [Verrucomicrobiales bacterium]|nr:hypothetical protein [Verrucomicrobiales bacterium]